MSAGLACVFDLPVSIEYEQGVRDGIEAAVRRFTRLRVNASSQHIHPASDLHPLETSFLRIDHIDEMLAELLIAVGVVNESANTPGVRKAITTGGKSW